MNRPPAQTATAASLRDYLFSLTLHGVKLGFDNIRRLLDAAGNPQDAYPTVHIAGTNGKGSVTAFLKAMLQAAGYRTGCFTSPHLIDVRERFQIDGALISDEDLDQAIAHFQRIAAPIDPPPTFFEMNTAIAFHAFALARVDVAIIETGMGGRLDSTNVIRPEATAITNIDLEHTQYLGDTLEKIAFEKAGILKHGVPVVIGERAQGPRGVLLERARALQSPAAVLDRDFTYALTGARPSQHFHYQSENLTLEKVPLALAGDHQGANAAIAATLAQTLGGKFPRLTEQSIAAGLANAAWPCRLEHFQVRPPNNAQDPLPVIIDVAHNVAGAQKLAKELDACVTILAIASDKDARGMIDALAPIASPLLLTTFDGKRALPLDALRQAAAHLPHISAPNLPEAIAQGLSRATPARPLLITGSIYTAGEARQLLVDAYRAPPLRF